MCNYVLQIIMLDLLWLEVPNVWSLAHTRQQKYKHTVSGEKLPISTTSELKNNFVLLRAQTQSGEHNEMVL